MTILCSRLRSSGSPEPPTEAPPTKPLLGLGGIANLFLRMRHLQDQAEQTKAKQIVLSSGDPKTHPNVAENIKDVPKIAVEYIDNYVCAGGVNVATLVRLTRLALLEHIDDLGMNVLTDEQWECTISGPKPTHNGTYKVQVKYSANAAQSAARDPHRPVAMDKAKGIEGLMTIIKRNDL